MVHFKRSETKKVWKPLPYKGFSRGFGVEIAKCVLLQKTKDIIESFYGISIAAVALMCRWRCCFAEVGVATGTMSLRCRLLTQNSKSDLKVSSFFF